MMKFPVFYSLVCLLLLPTCFAGAQTENEPLHGVSGYDYVAQGELELTFTHAVDYKNGNKQKGTYRIKSPVQLSFNRNDLTAFVEKPLSSVGYVENPVIASCGYPCGGGLVDIPQGGIRQEESWMQADVHFVSEEGGVISEINATGEIYPLMELFFSIPDYSKDLKAKKPLQFRLFIKGISDSQYHPVRNVKSKPNTLASSDQIDKKSALEEFDKTLLLPISVTCGSFFGPDLITAVDKMNFSEADAEKKIAFEEQFEREYFEKLPTIDAMKLINFLTKPSGNYESPFTGSFSSESEWGQETASFQGVLRFRADRIRKDE